MKIAVSSNGKDLDSLIDPRFSRCAYFLLAETDDMSFEVFDNQSIALGGIAGMEVFLGNTGIAREVLQKYKKCRR